MRLGLVAPAVLFMAGALSVRAEGLISGVSVSPQFFNPTVGQKGTIAFSLAGPCDAMVSILDRDLVPIRVVSSIKGASGAVRVEWDGRDDGGRVVPDEAYSVKIVCSWGKGQETFAPAMGFRSTLFEPKRSYSMASGALRYELDGASRVHIQAGQATLLADGKREGPVLRTVVDREPRSSGSVAEQFDGFDASGTIFIPSLKDFVISIMGESLPPGCLITVGNRYESFRDYVMARRKVPPPGAVFPDEGGHGRHHQGLNSLEDHTPALTLSVAGPRDAEGRVRLRGKRIEVRVDMNKGEAKHFLRPDSTLIVFVDEKAVFRRTGLTPPAVASIEPELLAPGEHRVAVNWVSPRGPVGVQVTRVVVEPPAPNAAGVIR